MLVPILLAFIVSDKKLWIILYDFPLDVIWIFLLASFKFFFSSINFQHFNYNIPWGSFLCLYIAWGFCNSLEKIHYCFFQWFFFPLSLFSLFMWTPITHMLSYLIMSHRTMRICSIIFLSLFCLLPLDIFTTSLQDYFKFTSQCLICCLTYLINISI